MRSTCIIPPLLKAGFFSPKGIEMSEIYKLQISTITVNGSTQARTEINQSIVAEYSEALKAGTVFPPVIVFEDGASIWLADGFHRYHAHLHAGLSEIDCDVRIGTQRQAILFSLSANASHGLRRTNEDKRKAVMTLLNDPEWSSWSDNAIAKACCVHHSTVGDYRKSILRIPQDAKPNEVRTVERKGKTYEQNTANIGKTKQSEPIKQEIKTEKQVEPEFDVEQEPDLHDLLDDAQKDNEKLLKELSELKKDNLADEVIRLNRVIDQLNGRLQGEITTSNEAKKQAKIQGDILAKIRKKLNVNTNQEILKALGA